MSKVKFTTVYNREVEIDPSDEIEFREGVNMDSVRVISGDVDDYILGTREDVEAALEAGKTKVVKQVKAETTSTIVPGEKGDKIVARIEPKTETAAAPAKAAEKAKPAEKKAAPAKKKD